MSKTNQAVAKKVTKPKTAAKPKAASKPKTAAKPKAKAAAKPKAAAKKAAPAKKVTSCPAPAALRFHCLCLMPHCCFAGRRQEVNNFSPKKPP